MALCLLCNWSERWEEGHSMADVVGMWLTMAGGMAGVHRAPHLLSSLQCLRDQWQCGNRHNGYRLPPLPRPGSLTAITLLLCDFCNLLALSPHSSWLLGSFPALLLNLIKKCGYIFLQQHLGTCTVIYRTIFLERLCMDFPLPAALTSTRGNWFFFSFLVAFATYPTENRN